MKEILRIGRQVASGLSAAHEQGLIHRDVKPSNILLQNGIERVQITDFGLARAVDDANITRTGEITGTPQYMSPEQAQGHPVDARSDLFSLGSVLYAMCTGRSPFRAETTMASLRRVCDDTPRPIREVNPEIPQWLTEIIDRLLEEDPEDRFPTATEVSDVLSRHLAHLQDPLSTPLPGSIETTSARNKQASRRHRRLFAACALLVLIGGLGLTEATGVTHVAEFVGTVLRIRTPNGTLVLEIDDPGVKVTIEGNGEEITISGAGIEKLQLRPGQYQVRATKDGKPVRLDQELATITRGGKQVVKVTLQRTATPQHVEIGRRVDHDRQHAVGGEVGRVVVAARLDVDFDDLAKRRWSARIDDRPVGRQIIIAALAVDQVQRDDVSVIRRSILDRVADAVEIDRPGVAHIGDERFSVDTRDA